MSSVTIQKRTETRTRRSRTSSVTPGWGDVVRRGGGREERGRRSMRSHNQRATEVLESCSNSSSTESSDGGRRRKREWDGGSSSSSIGSSSHSTPNSTIVTNRKTCEICDRRRGEGSTFECENCGIESTLVICFYCFFGICVGGLKNLKRRSSDTEGMEVTREGVSFCSSCSGPSWPASASLRNFIYAKSARFV